MAGSWTATSTVGSGYLDGNLAAPRAYEYEFTADAAAATVPDYTTVALSGALGAVCVDFDDTTAPDSATVAVKDKHGASLASGTLTATGYVDMDRPVVFVPGALTISVSGNSTNSAKAKVILVIF